MSESPTITLPDNHSRKQQLEGKLDEYRGRLTSTQKPTSRMATVCQIAILEALLQEGKVVTWDLSQKLSERYREAFDSKIFGIACAVIIDYCDTGGVNVQGGTGLPC